MKYKYRMDAKDRFFSKVDMSGDCWLWKGTRSGGGYGNFLINGKLVRAHRWSYKFFFGELRDEDCVLHSCDNPLCVNPSHLFIGSRADNVRDMISKGRDHFPGAPAGEGHPFSVLSDLEVLEMRKLRSTDNLSYQELADLFGVSKPTVQAIIKGFTWKHLL